jgi:PIN domain nuclease of toxin-antitoxin system
MRILLDTHMLIWASTNNLPKKAVQYIADRNNTLLFSPVSIWEVAIKRGNKRENIIVDPQTLYNGLIGARYYELPIAAQHALQIPSLPPIHKDPFDRILLAQAMAEGISLLTADQELSKYPGSVIFVG